MMLDDSAGVGRKSVFKNQGGRENGLWNGREDFKSQVMVIQGLLQAGPGEVT